MIYVSDKVYTIRKITSRSIQNNLPTTNFEIDVPSRYGGYFVFSSLMVERVIFSEESKKIMDNKFKIIEKLFSGGVCDKNNNAIDYRNSSSNDTFCLPLAYATALHYSRNNKIQYFELNYCNEIIKKLIKIVGTDESKITPRYIRSILIFNYK